MPVKVKRFFAAALAVSYTHLDVYKRQDENIVKGFATIKVKAEPKKAPAKK